MSHIAGANEMGMLKVTGNELCRIITAATDSHVQFLPCATNSSWAVTQRLNPTYGANILFVPWTPLLDYAESQWGWCVPWQDQWAAGGKGFVLLPRMRLWHRLWAGSWTCFWVPQAASSNLSLPDLIADSEAHTQFGRDGKLLTNQYSSDTSEDAYVFFFF